MLTVLQVYCTANYCPVFLLYKKCNIITLLFIIRMNIAEDNTLPIPGR